MNQLPNTAVRTFPEEPLRGYVEGYYGRLLTWDDREQLVQTLHYLKMNVWFYAPKEDPCHRLKWRSPWDEQWMADFANFCVQSQSKGVHVIAGLAPGLDFDFSALDEVESKAGAVVPGQVAAETNQASDVDDDYKILLKKAQLFLDSGADYIGLLMDDIDPDFEQRSGSFDSEGCAHATLANRLGNDLNICVLVVPRIYANELVVEDPDYLPDFADVLDTRHLISHCGDNVVSVSIELDDCITHLGDRGHRVVVWDNLYANDYCPRRLFVGEWSGRERLSDIMLNATGMPHTDRLLLEMMAIQPCTSTRSDSTGAKPLDASTRSVLSNRRDLEEKFDVPTDRRETWRALMDRHGVPKEFDLVAEYCWHPFCNGDSWSSLKPEAINVGALEAALDELLWRWKTPLGLEWYPYIMGLRQDLILRSGKLPALRVMKTQMQPLASQLLESKTETQG